MPGFEVFGAEEQDAVNEIFELNGGILFAHSFDGIRNGVYRVREFEKEFAARMGVPHAQAVSSCTAALKVALKSLGVGTGDEVITSCFTFIATVEAILDTGARPVIVDIDETLNLSPEAVEGAVTDQTKAIVPVHMMGAPARMDRIMDIAERHSLLVLEDNAQGCGGTFRGKALGTIGRMGVFSFDGGKTLTTGEGGMILTSEEGLYKRARAYHDHGHEYSENLGRAEEGALMSGFNYRMMELQAAIGLVQLNKLDMILQKQRENKAKLKGLLKDLPFAFRPFTDEDGEIGDALIFFLPTKEKADVFFGKMVEQGLGTKNLPDAIRWHFAGFWEHIFREHDLYRETWRSRWKRSADILQRAIALPVSVHMPEERIAEVAEKVNRLAGSV